MKKPKSLCRCGRLVRLRQSDNRKVWHRDAKGKRKWCIESPRYRPAQPKARVVVVAE